jgi:hypothetical protein
MTRQFHNRVEASDHSAAGFGPGQLALIGEIHQFAAEESIPIALLYIPYRDELYNPASLSNLDRTRRFTDLLGAKFLDGRQAFKGLSEQDIKDEWFVLDGHWNPSGSDRFAKFMSVEIHNWLKRSPARAQSAQLK